MRRIRWSGGEVARTVLTALAVLVLVAGCGVPRGGEATSVAADRVPYRLLSPAPPDESTPEPEAPRTATTSPQVYFVNDADQLVPFPVTLEAAGLDTVTSLLLDRLAAGPAEAARAVGMESALGPDVQLRLVGISDGVAVVELVPSGQPPTADRLPLAVGQLVLTATSVEGVEAVALRSGGVPVDVPLPGGEQVSGPVSALAYAQLLAPRATQTKAPPDAPAPAPFSTGAATTTSEED